MPRRMGRYRIEVAPAAERDLRALRRRIGGKDFERICAAVDQLAEDPRPPGVRKIEGTKQAYRVRVGAYRIVYEIYDREGFVLLLRVSRRWEGTYRQLS